MKRLGVPFLISAILHLFLLSQFHWNELHAKSSEPRRLTVSLVPALPAAERAPHFQADQRRMKSSSSNRDDSINAFNTNTSDYRLDMNQIRNQVKEYSRQQFATSGQGFPLYGDYYGTYTGDDSGVFAFYLDNTGQVTGSGESSATGIVFLVAGNITPGGVIHVIAKRGDAKVSLSGQLNVKTGKISGSWFFSGIAKGLFSGQHE
jgi:hypothetical protein